LITDHNVRETLGICDRAYIVNEGRIFASGAPAEIIEIRMLEKYIWANTSAFNEKSSKIKR